MRLLATTPVYRDGHDVPSASWERISRAAEIVRGPEHWQQRLERYALQVEGELAAERAVTDRDPRPQRVRAPSWPTRRDLQDFVADLAGVSRPAGRSVAASWRELARWAERLVRDHLAPESRRGSWPQTEQQAAEKIDAALTRLAGLDAVEASPGVDVFRRTLELELDADLGRVGRFGDGLLMGHVSLGLGLDLDRVFVCGLAEGLFPTRVHDDSLLPDADRRATDGALPLRASRVDDDHRRLLAALASASDERVLLFPRGDLRRTTERVPSRFLASMRVARPGRRSDSPEDLGRAARRLVRARALVRRRAGAGGIPGHRTGAPTPHVARPRARRWRRRRPRARPHRPRTGTRGRHRRRACEQRVHSLRRQPLRPRPALHHRRHRGRVADATPDLRVQPARVPARLRAARGDPRAAGGALRGRAARPREPGARDAGRLPRRRAGAARGRARARRAVDRHRPRPAARGRRARIARVYEAQGRTGRRLFWHRDRRRILAELDRFLTEDDDVRSGSGLRTIATELRFGFTDGALPVDLPLSDGRALRFRGAADRIDVASGGSLWIVDYKTGRPVGIPEGDPTAGGRLLQLPVYAAAARVVRRPDTPVGAAYWYVSTRGGFRWAELVLTPAVDARVDEVLRAIADGIDGGVFPCRVDPPTTWTRRWRSYTDPDARGTRDRYREWVRKREAPELHGYLSLAEPDGALNVMASATCRPGPRSRHRRNAPRCRGDDGGGPAVLRRPRRGPRHPERDRRRARRDHVRRGGRGFGQDQGARRSHRGTRRRTRRADARDRGGHVHREGRRRAARPHPARAGADRARRRRSPSTSARADAGTGGARRGGGVHPARLCPAHPRGTPGGGRPAAARAGARRHRLAAGVRGAVDPLRRRPARRSRARTHHPPRAQRRHHAPRAAHARAGVQRQLGPRGRAHARGTRSSAPRARARARRARAGAHPRRALRSTSTTSCSRRSSTSPSGTMRCSARPTSTSR